jgi:cell division protein ZapA
LEKPVRVRIFDHEYLIKSDEDEAYVQTIARYVNEKFWEVKEHTEGLSVNRTAILAAFHIASEYFQLQKRYDGLVKDIQSRAHSLNSQIDAITINT